MCAEPVRRVLAVTMYDRALPRKRLPRDDADVWLGRWPDIPYLRVAWHTVARLRILTHCYENPNVEVGGVLLGGVYRSPEVGGADDLPIDFVEIIDAIWAEQTTATVGKVEFTSESWARINVERDQKYPNLQIVGWYHTHPGHGVFLSREDRFIHNNFFAQDFQLALVIDTHANIGAFFIDSSSKGGPYKSEPFHWHHELLNWINRTHRVPTTVQSPVQSFESSGRTSAPLQQLPTPDISISYDELGPPPSDLRVSWETGRDASRTAAGDLPVGGRSLESSSYVLPSTRRASGQRSGEQGLRRLLERPVRLFIAIGLAVLIFILLFLVALSLFEGLLPGKYTPEAFAFLLAGLVALMTFLLVSLG